MCAIDCPRTLICVPAQVIPTWLDALAKFVPTWQVWASNTNKHWPQNMDDYKVYVISKSLVANNKSFHGAASVGDLLKLLVGRLHE